MSWMSIGIAGVVGSLLWPFWRPQPTLVLSLLGVTLVGVLFVRSKSFSGCLLSVMCFLLVSLRCSVVTTPSLPSDGAYYGELVWREGRIAVIERSNARVVFAFPEHAPRLGSFVALRYAARTPPIDLGGPNSLRAIRRYGAAFRGVTSFETNAVVSSPPLQLSWLDHGPVLWAFASGQRAGLSQELKELLRRTGTAHLLAISGLHVGIVAALAWWFVRVVCLPLIAWRSGLAVEPICSAAASLSALTYGALVGWPPSTQRAVVMVMVAALLRAVGRDLHLLDLIGIAALALVLNEPWVVSSLGFQLSFLAVLGIAVFSSPLLKRMPKHSAAVSQLILGSLATTIGATLGTLPLQTWVFQELPLVSPLANLLVTPVFAGIAVPASIVGCALPGVSGWLLCCVGDAAVQIGIFLLQLVDSANIVWPLSGSRSLLLGLVIFARRRVMIALLPMCLQWPKPPQELQLHFLPVGQGDATLVSWPNGENWLFDTGPRSWQLVHYLRRKGIYHLDHLVLTHPHRDHLGSMSYVVEKLSVGTFWTSRSPLPDEEDYRQLWILLHQNAAVIGYPDDLAPMGARIVHPRNKWSASKHKANEESMVWRVTDGQISVLLTGDIEIEAESALAPLGLRSDVLKVPHHGSRTSSSKAFVDSISPDLAVIQCGKDNRFGHPSSKTLWNLRETRIFRTDLLGEIIVSHNDGSITVRTAL